MKASAIGIQGLIKGVGVALAALGANAFAGSIMGIAELQDEIGKMSQRTGVAAEALSTLRYAADLSGVKLEDLDGLLVKLNKTLASAGAGDAKTAGFLSQFGIKAEDVSKGLITTDEALKRIADRFATSPDGINKTAAALELFGKAGAPMIAFLNQGRAGIEGLQDEARKLGLEISTNTTKKAEALNDQLRTLAFAGEGLKIAFLNSILEPLVAITRAMRDATIEGGKFRGFIVGLQTLLTNGDDKKNQEELIELKEKRLRLENEIFVAMANGQVGEVRTFSAALAITNDKLKSAQAYRIQLDLIKKAEEQAAANSEKARATGTQIRPKAAPEVLDRTKDELRAIQGFVDSIKERLQGSLSGEFDQLRVKAADVFSKVDPVKLSPEQAKKYAESVALVAEQIGILERRSIELAGSKSAAESIDAVAAASDQASDALVEFRRQQQQAVAQLEFELQTVGLLTIERDKLTAQRKIDAEALAALGKLPDDAPNRNTSADEIIRKAQEAKAQTNQLLDAIRLKNRETWLGATLAVNDYYDRVTNGAENVRTAVSNAFQGMEDALVKFTTSGKLDFKSFADGIISDLVRIQVRASITAPLAKSLQGFDFSSLFSSVFGGGSPMGDGTIAGFAGGGRPPVGRVSMVGERGPELFIPDVAGTIVPNSALGGGVTIVQNINVDSRSDRASILQAMTAAKEQAKAEILYSRSHGGAFA